MKHPSFLPLIVGGIVTALGLSACANQPNFVDRRAGSTYHANQSSGIPTRDDRNSTDVAGGPTGGGSGAEYRVPTGSNLPKNYNRTAYTTDNDDPSYVYDQNDIRIQSTNTVGDSLRTVPGVSVPGLTRGF